LPREARLGGNLTRESGTPYQCVPLPACAGVSLEHPRGHTNNRTADRLAVRAVPLRPNARLRKRALGLLVLSCRRTYGAPLITSGR
jgi:hypothetical protein